MDHSGSSFLCGCAPFTDMVFFSKELDELSDKDIVNSSFFLWDEQIKDEKSRWMKYDNSVEWRTIGFATSKIGEGNRFAVAIGSSGQYFEIDAQSLQESLGTINNSISGLRSLSCVEGTIFATGMGRVVLKRVSTGVWVDIGPGISSSNSDDVIGLEDIAGFSETDIYSVGWRGEIWWYKDSVWNKIDSPTSVNFNALTCARNGVVYAVGDNGIMVHGRENQWEILETERPENLLDVAFFDNEVYVVTDFKILKLKEKKLVAVDNVNEKDFPTSCLHLYESDDGIISMGLKDLFRLKHGIWERIV